MLKSQVVQKEITATLAGWGISRVRELNLRPSSISVSPLPTSTLLGEFRKAHSRSFRYLELMVRCFIQRGRPALSVDANRIAVQRVTNCEILWRRLAVVVEELPQGAAEDVNVEIFTNVRMDGKVVVIASATSREPFFSTCPAFQPGFPHHTGS